MKVLIAQGGGPTAVINQSLVGAVFEAKKNDLEILGSRFGIKGIVQEDFVALHQFDQAKLSRLADTPASALGSTRDKPDDAYCEKILQVFKKHDIRGVLYIGGNDSSETIRVILDFAKRDGFEMKGFHIPKTVDNDLMENDHTPGFPSAARFVAKATMGVERDNASLPGIHLLVIMGRHAGFLTTATALGGAHLVYIPEHPFDLEEFVKESKATFDRHGRAVIGISEGIEDSKGEPIISQFVKNEKDAYGNLQLSGLPLGDILANHLKEKLGISRVRQDTLGYPQRCFPDPSPIDQEEARKVGIFAVQSYLNPSLVSGSVTIHRVSSSPYEAVIGLTELEKVAGKTRKLPYDFYDLKRKMVTEKGLQYLRPLLGELPPIEKL